MSNENSLNTWSRRSFLVILGMVAILFFLISRPFFLTVAFAFIVAGSTRALYRFYFKRLRIPALASLATLLTLLLLFILPLTIAGVSVVKQGVAFFQYAMANIPHWVEGVSSLQSKIGHRLPFLHLKSVNSAEWANRMFNEVFKNGLNVLQQGIQGAGVLLLNGVVFTFSLYYFYIDWDRIRKWIVGFSPLTRVQNEKIAGRIASMSRSVLKIMVIIGLLQGILGGLVFALAGLPAPVFWGFVMAIVSVVPVVGTGLVWIPTVLISFFTGHIFSGILVLGFGVIIVGGLENFVRPRLVGSQEALHPLPVFIGTLGGIAFFGISGFIFGPLAVAMLAVLLEIYRDDIRQAS